MTTPADRRILPVAQAVLVDRTGRATPPFYDFLRRLVDTTALTPELVEEVKEILAKIEDLPTDGFMPITAQVKGQDSIEWTGLLSNGLTLLNLRGDTSDQRAGWYYGTGASTEKGWHRFYTALETGAGILKRNSGYVELGEVDDASDLPLSGNPGEAYWVRGEGDIEERGLWVWDADAGEWSLDTEASGIVGFEIAEGDYGDISVSDEGATWTINENVVTDEKLRDSAALSVIGRASNSTGDPADIVASVDKAVLHRNGTSLAFAPIDHTYISDFAEAAQDAVGGILTNTADIEFTYDDSGNEITARLSAGVHASLALADSALQPGDLADVAFSGDYSSLTGIPSTFPPSAHTHSASDITSGTLSNSRLSGVLAHRGDIGPGADLNTYTTTGIWHQNLDANAASGTNYPVAAAGMLRVYASSMMVYQEYFAYGVNATYIRKYYNGVWQPWHQVYDSGHKPSLADLGGGTITGNVAVNGALTVNAGAGALVLRAGSLDHVYMQFFADTQNPNTRSAYFGFGSVGVSRLDLVNEMGGEIHIGTSSQIRFSASSIVFVGRGGVLHYGDTFTSGRVFVRQGGSPVGTQEGDITIIW